MLVISVICDTRQHLEHLRSVLDESAVSYKLEVLDTDLGSLCHFRRASRLPDVVLVNGTLPIYEAPEFIADLRDALSAGRSRIAIMDPLEEDIKGLQQIGVSLFLRKPIVADALMPILTPIDGPRLPGQGEAEGGASAGG